MRPTEVWRQMVLARQRQMDAVYAAIGRTSADFWERRADRFHAARPVAPTDDVVVQKTRELAGPDGTVLDVGAGTGRLTLALAPLVRRVIAVEPASAMAAYLREGVAAAGHENVTVIEATWQQADVEPADVALCANVLYPIADVVPFIRRLEERARRAVVLAMAVTWAEPPLLAELWKRYHGDERQGQPEAFDTIAVLHELGIPANVLVQRMPATVPMWSFSSIEEALSAVREHLILSTDTARDAEIRAALEGGLVADGERLTLPAPERSVACIWWEHGGPRRLPLIR